MTSSSGNSVTTVGTNETSSAAADWAQFAALPGSTITTTLVPSTDPNSGGEMIDVSVGNGGQLGNTYGNGIGQFFAAPVANVTLTFDILVTSGQVTAGLVSTAGPFASGFETFYASPNWQTFTEQAGPAETVYFETLTSNPSNSEFFIDNVVASNASEPGSGNLLSNGNFEQVSCYFAGTLIVTKEGLKPVELLAAGDLVLTHQNQHAPIRWIGRQTVSTRFADPLRVLPIRIKAGALAEDVPSRDLLVSPDHAVLVDQVLIQAGALVNGASIVRETNVPMTFTYYHVELDDHSLIFAENTRAETFVDNIDRLGFDNWAQHEALYPDGKPIKELPFPRAKAHRQVPQSIRQRLSERARYLGLISAAA
jgi:hypothetical protein